MEINCAFIKCIVCNVMAHTCRHQEGKIVIFELSIFSLISYLLGGVFSMYIRHNKMNVIKIESASRSQFYYWPHVENLLSFRGTFQKTIVND